MIRYILIFLLIPTIVFGQPTASIGTTVSKELVVRLKELGVEATTTKELDKLLPVVLEKDGHTANLTIIITDGKCAVRYTETTKTQIMSQAGNVAKEVYSAIEEVSTNGADARAEILIYLIERGIL